MGNCGLHWHERSSPLTPMPRAAAEKKRSATPASCGGAKTRGRLRFAAVICHRRKFWLRTSGYRRERVS